MNQITKRQQAFLMYIHQYQDKRQVSPSHQEILQHFDLHSPGSVQGMINRLIDKGYLSKIPIQPRSIAFAQRIDGETFDGQSISNIPVLGICN